LKCLTKFIYAYGENGLYETTNGEKQQIDHERKKSILTQGV